MMREEEERISYYDYHHPNSKRTAEEGGDRDDVHSLLQSMGFTSIEVHNALEATNGDADRAAEILLLGQTRNNNNAHDQQQLTSPPPTTTSSNNTGRSPVRQQQYPIECDDDDDEEDNSRRNRTGKRKRGYRRRRRQRKDSSSNAGGKQQDDGGAGSVVRDETTLSSSSSYVWKKKLALVITLAVIPLIVIWCLRPIERIINMVLPPPPPPPETEEKTETNQAIIDEQEDIFPFTPLLFPPKSQFPFQQCDPNTLSNNFTLCCNGLDNICSLPINQVMFATVHNAMATKEDGYLLNPNHYFSLESALEVGYRGLHLEVCKCNGIYELCHGICNLGSRNPIEVFLNIERFLKDHRYEILLIHLRINDIVHQPVDLMEFYSHVMKNATRFSRNLYHHRHPNNNNVKPTKNRNKGNTKDDWPTLEQMINADKRVLLFHSQGSTCVDSTTCPPGFHYWPDYGSETVEVERRLRNSNNLNRSSIVNVLVDDVHVEVEAIAETCRLIGGGGGEEKEQQSSPPPPPFHALNHYLIPTMPQDHHKLSKTLNSLDTLSKRMESCANKYDHKVNFNMVSVDYWSSGDVIEFVQRENKAKGYL